MEERIPPFHASSQSQRPPAWRAIGFILLFFMGVLVVLFLHSDLSKIDQVEVEGNFLVSDEEVRSKAGLVKGADFFRWDADQARKALKQVPAIADVSIERSFPGTLRIQIREWETLALWQDEHGLYPLLANGSIQFKRPWENHSFDGPIIRDFSEEKAKELAEKLVKIPASTRRDLSEITPKASEIYGDLIQVTSRQDHLIYVQLGNFHEKLKLYPRFRNQPQGILYFLETTRYVPSAPEDL